MSVMKLHVLCEILGSHDEKYEDDSLLRYGVS
jgi:hypothetical protein